MGGGHGSPGGVRTHWERTPPASPGLTIPRTQSELLTLSDIVSPVLDQLAADSGLQEEELATFMTVFRLLTKESLALPAALPLPRFSGICNDGVPWQFCVSLGGEMSVRFLTEVGQPGMDLDTRTALTLRRVERILACLGASAAYSDVQTVARLAPGTADSETASAALWVAVAAVPASQLRLRVYANNGWGLELERWRRVSCALSDLAAESFRSALRSLAPMLVPYFSPAGLAVTVVPGSGAVKLYMRPRCKPWAILPELLRGTIGDAADGFLSAVEGGLGRSLSELPSHALVLSLAMPRQADVLDVKLDLCGHCLFASEESAGAAVDTLAMRLRLDPARYRRARTVIASASGSRASLRHAFVGFGFNPEAGARVEVYLEPPVIQRSDVTRKLAVRRPPTSHVGAAIDAAAHFLIAAEEPTGGWTDYLLPVGASTSWVTAYVADALWSAREVVRDLEEIDTACSNAARALRQWADHGRWSYNANTDCDADSTALALILLHSMGEPAPAASASLQPFRNADGGYGTFAGAGTGIGWGQSHADVTPTALRALGAAKLDPSLGACCASRSDNGSWHSYWWKTDLYATEANLRLLDIGLRYDECKRSLPWLLCAPETANAFEVALLSLALGHVTAEASTARLNQLLELLLTLQHPSGAWSPGAWLRVTYPECIAPWLSPNRSGPLYCDCGLFTTATALRALVDVARQRPRR